MTTATAIQHEDIKGRKLLYLKISNGEHHVFVNVGDKTFKSVKDLEKIQNIDFKPDDTPNIQAPPKKGGK